ncbi:MAG: ABC transporter ATP-binding protein [Deltaproteobacteria bacterium]|nr:ABC transporter ATP-binding protein [Deltaproteobacteria bacterium]
MLLELKGISAGYGKKTVLSQVSIALGEGRILAVVGPNGAGKTTSLRVISGQLLATSGSISFEGRDITKKTAHEKVRQGIALVPQGGKVFKPLTTLENLEMGGYLLKSREEFQESIRRVTGLFPILEKRKHQMASTLSGGEQQMLAIGRGLMQNPKLLLLDEPSLGLAPIILRDLMGAIASVRSQTKTSIIVVEQNVNEVLKVADEVYGMKLGKIVFHEDHPEKLKGGDKLRDAYMT